MAGWFHTEQRLKLFSLKKALQACVALDSYDPKKVANAVKALRECREWLPLLFVLESTDTLEDLIPRDISNHVTATSRYIHIELGIGPLLVKTVRWAVAIRCDGTREGSRKAVALEDLCHICLARLYPLGLNLHASETIIDTLCSHLFPGPSGKPVTASHACQALNQAKQDVHGC